ncbi:MAG: U32 family peptidase [Desulfovibrionales bacterium]
MNKDNSHPEILAPAGDRYSFLAALAAGADAIYCGLKHFSARMMAENFSLTDLTRLTSLAHERGVSVYIALNSLLKPHETAKAGRMLDRLARSVRPDAIIVQDLAMIDLARQAGFPGRIHLSTLANVSFTRALKTASNLGADRVILPRELSVDEMRSMADACPPGIDLEVFVHGALCYGISGRCWWSSYLGGRSGLRGRCVQPCRRLYQQGKAKGSFFSCRDLGFDILSKLLLEIPRIRSWKIEGRKKGPHYVFYATRAYQLIRDHPGDAQAKKDAASILDQSLGRPRTRFQLLSHKPINPIQKDGETGSGLPVSKVGGTRERQTIRPRMRLLPGDLLRVGTETDPWHRTIGVKKSVPKGGTFHLRGRPVPKGTSVFLLDRREPELQKAVEELDKEMDRGPVPAITSTFSPRMPVPFSKRTAQQRIDVFRTLQGVRIRKRAGLWLSPFTAGKLSKTLWPKIQWWLPPVLWPNEEAEYASLVKTAVQRRSRSFVLNAPWQISLFSDLQGLDLWAGPFCNISNQLAIDVLHHLGFTGAVVSPELGKEDLLALPSQSPLPLGIVLSGIWPYCISRIAPPDLKAQTPFLSPKGEGGWTRRHGQNTWVYPDWSLDLRTFSRELGNAGYSMFLHLKEPVPRLISLKNRPGLWNLEHGLL